jgi:hypothetical protein
MSRRFLANARGTPASAGAAEIDARLLNPIHGRRFRVATERDGGEARS